jgi:hypothetical protein
MAWRKNLGADLVRQAKASVGGQVAWDRMLTNAMKEAVIAQQVLGIVVAQDSGVVQVQDVEGLLFEARTLARLL